MRADAIADSIGVNIHLHNGDRVYGDFPLIREALSNLGVRHTRDGIIDTTWTQYYDRHVELGRMGIKCLFITAPTMSDALLANWPNRVPGAFEGYEAPNEYDVSGDLHWVETLKAFIPRLYKAVKLNLQTAMFPVIGPSVARVESYPELVGIQKSFDVANMHNYFGGRNPGTLGWGTGGYGSIQFNLDKVRAAWDDKPVWATETGYMTDLSLAEGIPESVEGKYAPRMVFEQILHGVNRTYIYELIDEGKLAGESGHYGLARIDGSHKPAYDALKALIATLNDPGPPFDPQSLPFKLAGASDDVHHLLMEKRDGSYYLAFWLERSNYDLSKREERTARPEALAFVSSHKFKVAQLLAFDAEGLVKDMPVRADGYIPLVVTDCVTILKLQ